MPKKLNAEELLAKAKKLANACKNVRESTSLLMKEGLIPPPPEEL